ncbi:MAG: DUF3772 domain-containing protein [Pseudomonadota bacterium]
MSRLFRLALAVLFVAQSAFAQSTETFDVDAFTEVADRARSVLENARASDDALTTLRRELVSWRDAAEAARERRSARLSTVQAQLDGLGPVPDDGSAEPTETAARRAEIVAQLDAAEPPVLQAVAAFERANGLINEIDGLIRARQTDALVSLGPSPAVAENWTTAISTHREYFGAIVREFRDLRSAPASRQLTLDRLPVTVTLLALSLLALWPWQALRNWADRWRARLTGRQQAWGVLAQSAFALMVPVVGITVGVYALETSGIFGFRGTQLLETLPLAGFCFAASAWLGWVLRMELVRAEEDVKDPQRVQILTFVMGIALGLGTILTRVSDASEWSEAAVAVMRFPIIVAFSVGLAAIWYLVRPGRWLSNALIPQENPASRSLPYLRALLAICALASPILAAVGYTQATYFLTSALLLSFGLASFCVVTFRILGQLSARFENAAVRLDDDTPEKNTGVLLRFALGAVIILVATPIFTLIWGARWTDLADFWARLQQGFSLGATRVTLADVLTLIVVFMIGYTITRAIQSTLRKTVLPNTRLDSGAQYALVAGTGYIGIFLSGLIAVTTTGLDLSGLAIVAGALSVGIGFGLQNIVSNFISGIILLIERPIKEGDWIEVNGYQGYVRNISVRSTEIETFDRSTVIVPNADLVTGTMTNFTHRTLVGRVIVPVGVGYDSDPKQVEQILREIAEAHPRVLLNPAPSIVFQGFGASSMDFEIRAIIRDVNWMLTVKSEMNFEIAKRFKAEGIEIPFDQRDVTIKNLAEISGKTC